MGKQNKPKAPWQQRGHGSDRYDHSSWELWRGSWKSASPKAKAGAFPSFDRAWGPKADIAVLREDRQPGSSWEESTARTAQAAVNNLRKAEQRVARLAREKSDKATRFAAYEKEIKAAFAAEEKRYMSIQERLAEDLVEAQKQLHLAKEAMAHAADEFRTVPMDTTSGQATSEADQWERMLRRTGPVGPPPTLDPELIELLRRYKRGEGLPSHGSPNFGTARSEEALATRPIPRQDHLEAPAGGEEGTNPGGPPGLAGPQPSYGAASPSAVHHRASPYPPTSPSGQHLAMDANKTTETAVHVEHPSSLGDGHQARSTPKTPVKEPHLGGNGLSQKLEEKRKLTTGPAMEPFRRNPEPPTTRPSLTGAPPQDTGQQQAMNFVDDDQDELKGAPSPGLGRLDG